MHSIIPLSPETRREALVALGLPLVERLSHRLARRLPPNVARGDLAGAGAEGLLRAIEAYDPTRCERFETYAEARIRGAMLDELRSNDSLTRHARRRLGAITRAARAIESEQRRPATDEEIAGALGIELAEYQRVAGELVRAPGLLRAGETDPDLVGSESADPLSELVERELRARLAAAIDALPERTREVVRLYYSEERTQAEIGRALGVTESRVCQILGKAVSQLRASLGASEALRMCA
ncbi:MAG: FliA/WhiG family RNA polymerase sigma factor [Myxococcota bacterium]|nr:FliA/WhiG family RNA polymerase sigma factor [Myxococcota bacterium]